MVEYLYSHQPYRTLMTGKDKRNKITSYIDVHAEQWRHLNRNKSMISNQATICWSEGPLVSEEHRHSEFFTLTNVYLRWYIPQPFILDMEWSKTHISNAFSSHGRCLTHFLRSNRHYHHRNRVSPRDRETMRTHDETLVRDGIDIGEEIEPKRGRPVWVVWTMRGRGWRGKAVIRMVRR